MPHSNISLPYMAKEKIISIDFRVIYYLVIDSI